MRVDLHARVRTRDEESGGHVRRALIDPSTCQVTELVVDTGGLLGRDVVLDRKHVEKTAADGRELEVRLTKAELEEQPAYESDTSTWLAQEGPPNGALTLPYGGMVWPVPPLRTAPSLTRELWEAPVDVAIDKGSSVLDCAKHEVGVVEDIEFDERSGHVDALVVRRGGPLRTVLGGATTTRLEVDLIASFEPDRVRLRVDKDSLEQSIEAAYKRRD